MYYAVTMAGGSGTRLWPLSRKNEPKQSQAIIGNRTLLQKTYTRLKKAVDKKHILITTGISNLPDIKKQLPELSPLNFSVEPERRDTAPALGLAAAILEKRDPGAIMACIYSDHYIIDEDEYRRINKLAEKLIRQKPDYTVILGINPTYPETGYGYIERSRLFKKDGKDKVYYVKKFVEKPDLKTAQRYVSLGRYLWNSGMFFWKAKTLLKLFAQRLPTHYKHLQRIQAALGTREEKEVLKKEYSRMKPVSIDYGIAEKTKKILTIPSEFGWTDVGHWQSVKEILTKDKTKNFIKGHHIGLDTNGSLIYAPDKKVVATIGLRDMIIVDTEDALLICPKDRSQDVKKLVKELEKNGQTEYL